MTTNLLYKASKRKVNGWTNYETWAANLWMDNDAKQYRKMYEAALAELRFFEGDKEAATFSFATSLQTEIEKAAPSYLKDVYQDLLNGALSAINYHEIAFNWLADIELTDEAPKSEPEPVTPSKPARTKAVESRSKHTLTATPEVLAILRRSTIDDEGLTLPEGQLPRDQYEAVNQFLELAGAKWNRSKGRHVFKGGAKPKIEALLATGQIEDEQKKFQAYYTPQAVATEIVELAGVSEGMVCLEPSAGAGAIAKALRAAGASPRCIEINPEAARELESKGFAVEVADFLSVAPSSTIDRIVMNPPFTGDQDIRHVLHALEFLKPGGKLYAIMSPGFTFGGNITRTEFKALVEQQGRIVKELAAGTFDESGTGVRTVIVELSRPEPEQTSLFTAA